MLTITTESRAARATISAHETIPGQLASSEALALVITLNPLRDRFGPALCSEPVPVSSTDPSHP